MEKEPGKGCRTTFLTPFRVGLFTISMTPVRRREFAGKAPSTTTKPFDPTLKISLHSYSEFGRQIRPTTRKSAMSYVWRRHSLTTSSCVHWPLTQNWFNSSGHRRNRITLFGPVHFRSERFSSFALLPHCFH